MAAAMLAAAMLTRPWNHERTLLPASATVGLAQRNSMRRSSGVFLACLVFAGVVIGAATREPAAIPRGEAAAPEPVAVDVEPYTGGRWRLVEPMELQDVMLWVSHLLIRHEGADDRVMGSLARWQLGEPVHRTRLEALELINRLAREVGGRPERFAAVAQTNSEDSTSALRGGSLGGLTALELIRDPQILDALSALGTEEVSRVIETSHGFHLLYRRKAPAPERVTGRHLVIGYRGAPGCSAIEQAAPRRSRAEAVKLAGDIRHSGAVFGESVATYSEHPDRALDGDIGTWSVVEPTPLSRSVDVLRTLAKDEVSEPFDTPCGIELIQRLENPTREDYAVEAVQFPFDRGDSSSRDGAFALASSVAASLAEDPAQFAQVQQRQGAPATVMAWTDGRGDPRLSVEARTLAVGQIGRAPVEDSGSFLVIRRVQPRAGVPRREPRFELPTPEGIELEVMVNMLSPKKIVAELLAIRREVKDVVLTESQDRALVALEQAVTSGAPLESSGERSLVERLTDIVGDRPSAYRRLLEKRMGERLLRAKMVRVTR